MGLSRRGFILTGLAALAGCGGGQDGATGGETFAPPPTTPPTDWDEATPASQGVPSSLMESLLASGAQVPNLRALLVVREGLLIGERYYGGASSADLFHVRSATKSVSSMLVGSALADGRLPGIDATMAQLLPQALAAVPGSGAGPITLREALSMRSGIDLDDSSLDFQHQQDDFTRFALSRPVRSTGTWRYESAGAHLPSPILQRVHGMNLQAVAARDLFGPLGIGQSIWEADRQGTSIGSFGLQLRTRDFIKLGWMALDGGRWKGRQVVPGDWLAASHRAQATGLDDGSGQLQQVGYGYLWWTGMLGGRPVVLAWGFGGQFAILVPSLRTTIATNCYWNVGYEAGAAQEEAVFAAVGRFLGAL
jgi:CubicO group peptidase (beta-lactamase class C family)